MRALFLSLATCVALTALDVNDLERFVLDQDRAAVLSGLVPDSDDARYYGALDALQHQDFQRVDTLLHGWAPEYSRHPQRDRIRLRRILATWNADPEAARTALRALWHWQGAPTARQTPSSSSLDPQACSRESYQHALANAISEADPWVLDQVLGFTKLLPRERGELLDHLPHAALEGIESLIIADQADYGARNIHSLLTSAQLREIARELPQWRQSEDWALALVQRALPEGGLAADPALRLTQCTALEAALPSNFPSLQHALYWERLEILRDLEQSDLDLLRREETLSQYRGTQAKAAEWLGLRNQVVPHALLDWHYRYALASGTQPQDLPGTWNIELRQRAQAEERLVSGDPTEPWLSLLGPEAYRSLLEQKTLTWRGPTPRFWQLGQLVRLPVRLKNQPSLRLRVFHIDGENWYANNDQAPSLSVDLDAYQPLRDQELSFNQAPMLRHDETIDIPEIQGRGIWVVDIVGDSSSLRAVIHIGALQVHQTAGPEGIRCRIIDEQGQWCPQATLRIGERSFAAGPDGSLLLPWTTEATNKKALIQWGDYVQAIRLQLPQKWHRFDLGLVSDPQLLVPGSSATLVLRPTVSIAQTPIPLKEIEDVRYVVTWEPLQLHQEILPQRHEGGWLSANVQIPREATALQVQLHGEYRPRDKEAALSLLAETKVSLGQPQVFAGFQGEVYLRRNGADWFFELRDGLGQPLAGKAFTVSLQYRGLPENGNAYKSDLRTDHQGRIFLGPLPRVQRVRIRDHDGSFDRRFALPLDQEPSYFPQILPANSPLSLPWTGGGFRLVLQRTVTPLGLTSQWGQQAKVIPLADVSHLAQVNQGLWHCAGLEAGNYHLYASGGSQHWQLRVLPRQASGDLGASDLRAQELLPPALSIRDLYADATGLHVQVDGADNDTRVQVLALCSWADTSSALPRRPLLLPQQWSIPEGQENMYADRQLSTELRYILQRHHQRVFAGALLERPDVLLDPHSVAWKPQESEGFSALGSARGGGKQRAVGANGGGKRRQLLPDAAAQDFGLFPQAARLWLDLPLDASGALHLNASELGQASLVQLRVEHPRVQLTRTLGLPTPAWSGPDRRSPGLQPGQAVVRQVSLQIASAPLPLASRRHARIATLEDLWDIFCRNETVKGLRAMRYLSHWSSYSDEEKLSFYSKDACHELRIFIALRDPTWFARVLKPHLGQMLQTDLCIKLLLDQVKSLPEAQVVQGANNVELALLARALPAYRGQLLALLDARVEQPESAASLQNLRAGLLLGFDGSHTAPAGISEDNPSDEEEPTTLSPQTVSQNGWFRAAKAPQRWMEARWRKIDDIARTRLPVHAHLRALAQGITPVLVPSLLDATNSVSDAILALAVADLPEQAETTRATLLASETVLNPQEQADSDELRVQLAVLKQGKPGHAQAPLLGEAQLQALEPYQAYTLRAVCFNASSTAQTVTITLPIPAGALAISPPGRDSVRLVATIAPLGSESVEAVVSFPALGKVQFPGVSVATLDSVVAQSPSRWWQVVTAQDPRSAWERLCAEGSEDELLLALAQWPLPGAGQPAGPTLPREGFGLLAQHWPSEKCRSRALDILAQRGLDAGELQVWALDSTANPQHVLALVRNSPWWQPSLDTPWGRLDTLESLDFLWQTLAPLHPSRSTVMGAQDPTVHPEVQAQHQALLNLLAHRPRLSSTDWLLLAMSFAAQERLEPCLSAWQQIDPTHITQGVQYDYLSAWLAWRQNQVQTAEQLARTGSAYRMSPWRERFQELLAQCAEAQGLPAQRDQVLRSNQNQVQAAQAARLDLTWNGSELQVHHQLLDQVTLRAYALSSEVFFSRSPFASMSSTPPPVSPSWQQTIKPQGEISLIPIPTALLGDQCIVVASGAGIRRHLLINPSQLRVAVLTEQGQIEVRDPQNKPIAAAYVKVYYQQEHGREDFYKDGYTDPRGRFDYVNRSPATDGPVQRFAVLVQAPGQGTRVVEAQPPQQ